MTYSTTNGAHVSLSANQLEAVSGWSFEPVIRSFVAASSSANANVNFTLIFFHSRLFQLWSHDRMLWRRMVDWQQVSDGLCYRCDLQWQGENPILLFRSNRVLVPYDSACSQIFALWTKTDQRIKRLMALSHLFFSYLSKLRIRWNDQTGLEPVAFHGQRRVSNNYHILPRQWIRTHNLRCRR